jgi:hypothetical protein
VRTPCRELAPLVLTGAEPHAAAPSTTRPSPIAKAGTPGTLRAFVRTVRRWRPIAADPTALITTDSGAPHPTLRRPESGRDPSITAFTLRSGRSTDCHRMRRGQEAVFGRQRHRCRKSALHVWVTSGTRRRQQFRSPARPTTSGQEPLISKHMATGGSAMHVGQTARVLPSDIRAAVVGEKTHGRWAPWGLRAPVGGVRSRRAPPEREEFPRASKSLHNGGCGAISRMAVLGCAIMKPL